MDGIEMLIDRLREVAKDVDHPRKRTLLQAADMLEQQHKTIMELQRIAERQGEMLCEQSEQREG